MMPQLLRSSTLLVALSLASTNLLAKDIFVSTSGNDANTGASSSSALKTLAAAAAKAMPGDIVQILPGRYQETLKPARSGTAGHEITFRSYGSTHAVLTHSSVKGLDAAISVTGVSYIVIDGIDVDGVQAAPKSSVNSFATIKDATGVTLRGGKFHYANGWGGVNVDNSSYVTIEDNSIDNVGEFNGGSKEGTGDAIAVRGGTITRVLIQRNTLRHGGHNLLRIVGRNCVVQDNKFDNSYADLLGGDNGYRIGSLLATDSVFQRNYVVKSGGDAYDATPALQKVEGKNNIVRQNIFAYSIAEGVSSGPGSWSPVAADSHIYNNTFYNLNGPAWIMQYYDGTTDIGRMIFMNNLIVDSRKRPVNTNNDSDILFALSLLGGAEPTASSKVIGNLFAPADGKAAVVMLMGSGGRIGLDVAQTRFPSFFQSNREGRAKFVSQAPSDPSGFDLATGSPGVDGGVFLTKVVGSGASNKLRVADVQFFTDGFGIIPGDMIQLQHSTERARVTAVDTTAGVLTLSTTVKYLDGQGVGLAYEGAAPDIGAREQGASSRRPNAPTLVKAN